MSERAVRAGRGRTVVTGRWDELLKQTARLPCRLFQNSVRAGRPGGRAVDGRSWRAAGMIFWNKRHGFLTDCFKSQSKRAVGAGRGRTVVTGRWDDLLKQTARLPHRLFQNSVRAGRPGGRAVDGRSWRAAGMIFWNKRHGFLTDCFKSQSERAVGAGRGRTVVTGRWDDLLKQTARLPHRLFQKSVRAGRGGGPWTDGRDGPLGWTFETNGTASSPIVSKVSQSGPWGRVVDGRSWRAAGMNFWNKRHGFLADCFKSQSERAVGAGRGRTSVTGRWDGLLKQMARLPRRLFQKSVRAGRGGGPWTDVRDGPLGWTFETNGTASLRRLFQKSIRAGRGGGPWTDVRDGPLGRTFETNGTASLRRLFQKSVRAGRDALDGTDSYYRLFSVSQSFFSN